MDGRHVRRKGPTAAQRIAALEAAYGARFAALEAEVRDLKEKLLKELARALHGGSTPPPPKKP